MLITYTDYLCVVFVCVCPGEGNVAFNATPNPFHLNKICLNQCQAHVTYLLSRFLEVSCGKYSWEYEILNAHLGQL